MKAHDRKKSLWASASATDGDRLSCEIDQRYELPKKKLAWDYKNLCKV